ncbi:MAG: ABC transporter ATP-binding protein [Thermoplasmatota archaeon]
MLEVRGLSKSFGDVDAVVDMDVKIDAGEVYGLIGPNGAGKTTAIKCISTLLRPDSGTVKIDGYDISVSPEKAKRSFAYVPEVPNPYPQLTVEEHIKFVARAFEMDDWKKRADRMISGFDLEDKRKELTKYLSKGMKQKVSVICAFIHEPKTILLDEPLMGIDPKGGRYLKDLIDRARKGGSSIIVSSHMLDLVEDTSTHLMIMSEGEIITKGTVREVEKEARAAEGARLEELFLKITEGK